MATITVRDLPECVLDRLRERAGERGRSMEVEVMSILIESLGVEWTDLLLEIARRPRTDDDPGIELEQPPRDFCRPVEFE